MVRLLVTCEGGSGDAEDLFRWLRDDPVSNHADLSLIGGSSDQMGAGETIQAVFDSAVGLGGFVMTVMTWLSTRRGRGGQEGKRTVTIERDGVTVTLDSSNSQEIEDILRELRHSEEHLDSRD